MHGGPVYGMLIAIFPVIADTDAPLFTWSCHGNPLAVTWICSRTSPPVVQICEPSNPPNADSRSTVSLGLLLIETVPAKPMPPGFSQNTVSPGCWGTRKTSFEAESLTEAPVGTVSPDGSSYRTRLLADATPAAALMATAAITAAQANLIVRMCESSPWIPRAAKHAISLRGNDERRGAAFH